MYVNKATKTVVATNYPDYQVGRKTGGRVIYTNSLILHESLSRNREDLVLKLSNWGHNTDVDLDGFMKKWDSVDETNYKSMTGFFYLEPMVWEHLDFIEGSNFEEVFENFKNQKEEKMYKSTSYLFKKNFGQIIKYIFN